MGKYNQQEPDLSHIPIWKRLLNSLKFFIKRIILYPFFMKKIYSARKAAIFNMLKIFPSYNLRLELNRLVFLVNLFINLPMFLSIIYISIISYFKQGYISRYLSGLFSPLKKEGIFDMIIEFGERIYLGFKFFPYNLNELIIFLGLFSLSVLGAKFLRMNTFFEKEEDARSVLKDFGMFGKDGETPWRVTITDEAILFEAYKHDPEALKNNKKFWNSFNYRAGYPVINEENKKYFVVPKKRTLPSKIELTMKGVDLKEMEDKYGK